MTDLVDLHNPARPDPCLPRTYGSRVGMLCRQPMPRQARFMSLEMEARVAVSPASQRRKLLRDFAKKCLVFMSGKTRTRFNVGKTSF